MKIQLTYPEISTDRQIELGNLGLYDFSLQGLLNSLPVIYENPVGIANYLTITSCGGVWKVGYIEPSNITKASICTTASVLIDAVYEMLLKINEEVPSA